MGAEFLGVAEESPSKIYISGCMNDEKTLILSSLLFDNDTNSISFDGTSGCEVLSISSCCWW
jgi:hypothetical protein